ncbi:MAG: metallophosphoesterase family protein [Chloroflexota bacterium]|nr:metallophosphoesterase family protein [Chloroflexota bacterium]MDE3193809.1 metallophosphoesterase family protein [Chloroflexota bacterium]
MKVALLSDVHANLVALEAVLAAAGTVDAIWVMGDTVGYGPDPSDVLALLRERDAVMVAGNHDLAAATGEGLDMFNGHAAAAVKRHRSWLSAEERDALAALPLTREVDRFTLCHGSLRDPIWEYVVAPSQAHATLRIASTPHCCNGHTHVPAVFRDAGTRTTIVPIEVGRPIALDASCLVNPGSVGQPRDGDPDASYALLDTAATTVTFARARYDVAKTQERIRARGLPAILADRLSSGF